MIKTLYSLIIAAFTALVTLGVTISHQAHAGEVNFTSFSVEPFTDVESDGRRSLHMRVCGLGTSIDSRAIYGSVCARLKTDVKPGSRWKHYIIFEAQRFSVFPIKTSGKYDESWKFWLRERSTDDTQNFYNFLKKAPTDGQLAIGGICQKLSDKAFFNMVIARRVQKSYSGGGGLDRRVMKDVSLDRAANALTKIASRCAKTAERIAGPIQVSTGTLASSLTELNKPKVTGYKICNFPNTKGPLTTTDIRKMQSGLKILGYYFGKIDGDFGTGSCKALTSFMNYKKSKTFSSALYSTLATANPSQRPPANSSNENQSRFRILA